MVKQFLVGYTTETFEILMEHEVNGVDYKYVYGNDRLSVNVTGVENGAGHILENGEIRLYYHMDLRGTVDYLTSPVSQKVESWTHYNEWGEITHNAIVKCGQREFDLVKRYATHDYDQVLGLFYAKARFYDAENRRFTAVDPIKGNITDPMSMVQYLYCTDNPLRWIDPDGRRQAEFASTSPSEGKTSSSITNKELSTLTFKENQLSPSPAPVPVSTPTPTTAGSSNVTSVGINGSDIINRMRNGETIEPDEKQIFEYTINLAKQQNRKAFAGAIKYQNKLYEIYLPAVATIQQGVVETTVEGASNVGFSLSGYTEIFNDEIEFKYKDYAAMIAGGTTSMEDSVGSGNDVLDGVSGALGWAHSAAEKVYPFSVRVILYESTDKTKRFATIEFGFDFLDNFRQLPDGKFQKVDCKFGATLTHTLDAQREHDKYMLYIYQQCGNMYGYSKKYAGDNIKQFSIWKGTSTNNYNISLTFNKALEEQVRTALKSFSMSLINN